MSPVKPGKAHIATDAEPDIVDSVFFHLIRPLGIGNQLPAEGDDVIEVCPDQ